MYGWMDGRVDDWVDVWMEGYMDGRVDKWMDGIYDPKEIVFPTYSLLQLHKIKGAGINIFEEKVRYEYDIISDAYNKTCDQAVEAYSHIKKGDLRKMMKVMEK